MSKVNEISNNGNKYNPNFDLKQIYLDLSFSPFPLITYLSKYYALDFENIKGKYICKQHNGIKIEPVKGEKTVFTINSYSNALGIKSGQLKTQLFELTKDFEKGEKAKKQIEILIDLGLIDSNAPKNTARIDYLAQISTEIPQPYKSTENEKEGLKMPNFTTYSTIYGKTVLSFLQNKTGATVETLEKYQVLPTKSNNELRYSYKVCLTVKSKYPNRTRKAGKYGTYNHSNKYLFGFNQLPKKGKYLIVASGEDDTICINHHLSHFGIFAVCGWNETTAPPIDLLNGLKTRFERCFYLGHNDNPQTTAKSQEIALKNGLIWIDTSEARTYFNYPQTFDICDIHQANTGVKDFVLYCVGANYSLPRWEDDPDSIRIDHCFKLNFAQHIGQEQPNEYNINTIKFILNKIKYFDRVILESLAGTGKSTALIKLVHQAQDNGNGLVSPNLQELKTIGIERVIILEPTTAINNQLPNAFKDSGLMVGCIDNQSNEYDVLTAIESPVLMVCYDSLVKVLHLIDNALVIVDEYHQLPIDINFRNPKAFRLVLQSLSKAKKVLLLSATPNYLFTLPTAICGDFGYKLIKGIPSVQNEIVISPLVYEGKRSDTLNYIQENAPNNEGVITIKFDSKANLESFTQSLKNRSISCDYFCSDNPQRKENNINYQSIMNTGFLKEPLKFLGYTTLMEAGVSIKNEVSLNCLIDTESWQKAIQLISRARYDHNNGINKTHNVWIFRSLENIKKEKTYNAPPLIERFKSLLETVEYACKMLNSEGLDYFKNSQNTAANDFDVQKTTYKDEVTGLYKPCILWILRTLYDQEKSVPFALLLKRIERFDNRVKVQETEFIQVVGCPELEAIRNEQKATKEETQYRLYELAVQDINNTAQTVCYLSKNTEFKDHVRNVLKLPIVHKSTVTDFLRNSQGAFTGNEPNRLIKDVCFAVESFPTKPVQDIVRAVVETDKKTMKDIKSQTARKQRKKAIFFKMASSMDMFQQARESMILKRLDQAKKNVNKGLRSEWLTTKDITNMVNKGIEDFNQEAKKDKELKIKGNVLRAVNPKKAMIILNDLYHVERGHIRVKDKQIWAYKIGERKGTNTQIFSHKND